MEQSSFAELFSKYIDNACTPEEVDQLMAFLQDDSYAALRKDLVSRQLLADLELAPHSDPALQEPLEQQLQHVIERIHTQEREKGRLRQLVWGRVAAAVVALLLLGGALYYRLSKPTAPAIAKTPVPSPQQDVRPGGDRAILTLDGGKQVILDSAANGLLAQQGNTHIIKTADGLTYSASSSAPAVTLYNTMTTPRGGQYQLTLPDGTAVWLNAASSIRYPTAFTGNTRKVFVTGEVYFEVKPGKMPFVVAVQKTGGKGEEVNVLGTHFNINAYDDEEEIATTLLEGKVSVSNTILRPGQQALLPEGKPLQVVNNADIEQVMAWKNHLFKFDSVDLKKVMRQLSRWYDVEISYEKDAPVSELFYGEMQRSLNLSQVLNGLGGMGVHFKIEGRRLLVTP